MSERIPPFKDGEKIDDMLYTLAASFDMLSFLLIITIFVNQRYVTKFAPYEAPGDNKFCFFLVLNHYSLSNNLVS
jgi:hypothetical protein